MPEEQVISNFSGGMNASVAVDKLAENECLLAENCRFDETGNVLITGANSTQGTYGSAGFHSLFFDPIVGAIAGAGQSVYKGNDFTSLALDAALNSGSSKMSFGVAPNRVYMDLSAVGYFKDISISSLVTVDWAPPSGNVATGPNLVQTGSATGSGITWATASNITGTASYAFANIPAGTFTSQYLRGLNPGFSLSTATAMSGIVVTAHIKMTGIASPTYVNFHTRLIRNGVPTGTQKDFTLYTASLSDQTIILGGNSTDLWGVSGLSPADVNSATFGCQITFDVPAFQGSGYQVAVNGVTITAYQGAGGFVAGTGAAGTLTGTYTWKLTFVAINGEESDGSQPSSSVVLATQAGTLTAISTGDARTVSRNVYRKGGSLTSYYLVGSIGDNISTTYSDNMTDLAALTQGIILAGDTVGDEPNTRLGNQQVKYPTYHYDRVFWAKGNFLIWSKPLNGFAYPADFSVPVGDGKSITGIFSMGGELFILKPDSIYRFSGTDENSFLLSKTLSPVGTDWPFTAVLSGGAQSGFYFSGRILFANSRGIWAFNGYTSNKITPKLDLWFRQDNRTGISLFGQNGFNPPEITNAAVTVNFSAAASPTFYYLAYAEAGQLANNAALVLDLERGTISKRSTPLYGITADPVQGYFYGGAVPGSILKLDDWNAINGGFVTVNFDFQDKYRDMKLRGSRFALFGLEFLIKTNGNSVTPSVYFDDGTASETLAAINPSGTVPSRVYRKTASANSRYCRNFSFRLNSAAGNANSNGIPNIELVHVKAYFEPRGARARTGETT